MTRPLIALIAVSQVLLVTLLVLAALLGSAPMEMVALACGAGVLCAVADVLLVRKVREIADAELAAERVRILEEQLTLQQGYRESLEREAAQARDVLGAMAGELRRLDERLRIDAPDTCLEDLRQTVVPGKAARLCDHKAIDALLAAKLQACEEKGIRATLLAEVPQDVSLPMVDACAAFSNVLDNAINACEAVRPDGRWIDLRARTEGGYLVIKASNSCAAAAANARAARRRNDAPFREHGWGLTILQGLADRYDGALSTQQSGETWQTTLMLQLS